jgi:hypothetical protein
MFRRGCDHERFDQSAWLRCTVLSEANGRLVGSSVRPQVRRRSTRAALSAVRHTSAAGRRDCAPACGDLLTLGPLPHGLGVHSTRPASRLG